MSTYTLIHVNKGLLIPTCLTLMTPVYGFSIYRYSRFRSFKIRTDYNHVSRGDKVALYFHVPCNILFKVAGVRLDYSRVRFKLVT